MVPSWWRRWLARSSRPASGARRPCRRRRAPGLRVESLEDRVTPALHVWTGGDASFSMGSAVWSDPSNWSGGAPVAGEVNVVLTFPESAAAKSNVDDISGLAVLQLNFTGGGYNLSGPHPLSLFGNGIIDTTTSSGSGHDAVNTIGINLLLAGNVPMHVADPARAVHITGTISGGGIVTGPASSADLVVTKIGPASVAAGSPLTYTVSVSNHGPSAAQNAVLTDAVPDGTTFVSETQLGGPLFNCSTPSSVGGGTVSCTAGSLAAGSSAAFQVVVQTGTTAASVVNTATAISGTPDPDLSNNSAVATTTVTPLAVVSLNKVGPTSVVAGTDATYSVTVSNKGPSDAQNVVLTDAVPNGTKFASGSQTSGIAFDCASPPAGGTGTFSCAIVDLPAGQSASFNVVLFVPPDASGGTTFTNTALVDASTAGGNPIHLSASVTAVINTQANGGITKTGPGTVTAGGKATYTITVSNDGPSDAPSVTLTDVVPAGTTFVSESQTGGPVFSCSTPSAGGTGPVNCTIATLHAGTVATFTLVVQALSGDSSGSIVTNTAQFTINGGTPVSVSSQATVTTAADVGVSKTGPFSPLPAGSNATFSIVVSNAGPSDAQSVNLSDVVPAGTTFGAVTQTTGPAFTCSTTVINPTVTCTIGTLPAGQSAIFQLVLQVSNGAPSSISNVATVTTTTMDSNAANNSSTATFAVQPPSADLAVTKTGPNAVTAGSQATYNVSVTNNGPNDAQNVNLTDTVSNPNTISSLTPLTGPAPSCPSPSGNTATCLLGTLAANQSATFQVVVNVASTLPSTANVSNTASVNSSTNDPNSFNNSFTVSSPNAAGILVVNGSSGNDAMVLTATDATSGTYTLNGGSSVPFSGISEFVFNGGGGDDTFTINNPNGGLFAPAGGIAFNNNSSSHGLLEDLGGAAPNGGEFDANNFFPDVGSLFEFSGTTTQDIFASGGLGTVHDTVTSLSFSVFAPAGNVQVNVVDGPSVGGTATTEVNGPSFPTVDFANKTRADVISGSGNASFTLDATTAAAGLGTLALDAGPGNDQVQVIDTPVSLNSIINADPNNLTATVQDNHGTVNINGNGGILTANILGTDNAVIVNGGGGLATVNVTNSGSVQGIHGPVDVENPLGSTAITVDDSADSTGRTVTLGSAGNLSALDSEHNSDPYSAITGLAPAPINFENADTSSLTIDGCSCGNTFNVSSTGAKSTTINSGTGNDVFNITGSGLGANTSNNFNGQDGNDVFNVTGPVPLTATVHLDGGPPATAPGDVLNYTAGGGALILGVGTIAESGGGTVNYTNFETFNPTNFTDLTVNDNQLVVMATTTNSGTLDLSIGGLAFLAFSFSNLHSLVFNGSPGNDLLTIDNPAGGLFAPTGGIDYTGGVGSTLQDLGGQASNGLSIPTGADSTGFAGDLQHVNGPVIQDILYSGLSLFRDTVTEPSFTVDGTSNADVISLTDGGPSFSLVADNNAATVSFANKTDVTINGLGGSDVLNADVTTPAPGLTDVFLNGFDGSDVASPDGPNTFNVTPSPVLSYHVEGDFPNAPGNTLNVDTAGTTIPFLNFSNTPSGLTGQYTFGNRQLITFQEVQTLDGIDLGVTKTDNQATAAPGTRVTYTIVVTNNGPVGVGVGGVSVTDTLPPEIDSASWTCQSTGGSSCSSGIGSGNINETDTLAAGGSVTYVVVAHIAFSATGNLNNIAHVAPPAGLGDTNPANNAAIDITELTPLADLILTKVGPSSVAPGGTVTYTLLLSNAGNTAQNVTLTDPLPAGTVFVSETHPASFSCADPSPGTGGTIICTLLPQGATGLATFTVVVQVTSSVAVIENTAVASTSAADANPHNNIASWTSQVSVFVPSGPGGLTKSGAGTLELDANNTYTGPTVVDGGLLLIDGAQPSSAVLVNAGTLGGHGTSGSVLVNPGGRLAAESDAAHTPSTFTVGGSLSLTPGAVFDVYINSPVRGSGYGTVQVSGPVNLGGATLNPVPGAGFDPDVNTNLTLVLPMNSAAVGGIFFSANGGPLGEGAVVPINRGNCIFITYKGGSGNEVDLKGVDNDLLFVEAVLEALSLPANMATFYAAMLRAPRNLSRPQVVNNIWTSQQHSEDLVNQFINNFGFQPSSTLHDSLVTALQHGTREGLVTVQFLTSREFRRHYHSARAFVKAAFRGLYNREIGRHLLRQLVTALHQGTSRAVVVAMMLSNSNLDEEALKRSVNQLFDPGFALPAAVHDTLIAGMEGGLVDGEGLFSFFTTQQFTNAFLAHFKKLCQQVTSV
jgi:uncharacterized repeat protein (TIGR01451 family)